MSPPARVPPRAGRPPGRAVALGRLVRISLAPTALADAALGLLLGARGLPFEPLALLPLLAALSVYSGGMALNDWADRREDAHTRPARPIPSGAVSAGTALALAALLLVGGVALAFAVDPLAGAVLACVALTAALYDLVGRGPWLGPTLLALCRAGNVSAAVVAGAALAGRVLVPELFLPALVYGAYVFVVSRLGRLEDDPRVDPGRRPRPLLAALAALLVLGPFTVLIALHGEGAPSPLMLLSLAVAFVLLLLGALPLLRLAGQKRAFKRGEVVACMGLALRRLLLFQAAAALLTGLPEGLLVGALLLALAPLGRRLARTFPPS